MRMLTAITVSAISIGCSSQDYVSVPVEKGPALLRQCTRDVPAVGSFWAPPAEVLGHAEQDLRQILLVDARLNPETYFRQYVGVTVAEKRLIYLNAVKTVVAKEPAGLDFDLHDPIIICDGGTMAFGALYDPAARRYFALAVNEVGG